MANIFQNNIKLLHEYNPALAVKLGNHVPSQSVRVIDTPSGLPSIRIDRNGREILLHSGRDPGKEAQRWAERANLDSSYNLMVLGCGLFHHIFHLVQRCKTMLNNLVIVEENIDVLYAVFQTNDLGPYLLTKSTHFLLKPSVSEIRDFINKELTTFSLNGLSVIQHPASVELNPEYYQQIVQIVKESMQSGEILLRTKVQIGGMIQENIIRNFPALLSSPPVSQLRNILQGKPAFVIAAGPSLDRQLDELEKVADPGVIIASDTVFKTLTARGIHPHFVVSTDPTPLNARHFEGLTDLGESVFVFSPSLYHKVANQLGGSKVAIPLQSARLLKTLRDVFPEGADLKTGTNVGQTCFNLAVYLGCDPVILVGLDLSFPKEGGTTHFTGAALNRQIKLAPTPGKMSVELIGDVQEWEEFDPVLIPANNGGMAATNKFWLAYLRSFEEEFKKTPVQVFNCSDSGARIEGALFESLSSLIQRHIAPHGGGRSEIKNIVAMTIGFFFGDYKNAGREVLTTAREILGVALENVREGLKELDRLRETLASGSPDPDALERILARIKELHGAAIQEQKLYVVLDEAADRVLVPFLQLENRPKALSSPLEIAMMTLDRYQQFFTGMEDLCSYYDKVISETIDSLGADPFEFSSFAPPPDAP
ncbi:MAG: DUF115 domain-containing protein [bacterium]|nr:DUF115 domain-containing protein [bacterium]